MVRLNARERFRIPFSGRGPHLAAVDLLVEGEVRLGGELTEFVGLPLLASAAFDHCGNLTQLFPPNHPCMPPAIQLALKVQMVTCFCFGMSSAPVLLKHQERLLETWKDSIWSLIGGTHNGSCCRG